MTVIAETSPADVYTVAYMWLITNVFVFSFIKVLSMNCHNEQYI